MVVGEIMTPKNMWEGSPYVVNPQKCFI